MGKLYRIVFSICFLFSLVACQTIPLYEQNTIHPDHQWNSAKPEKYLFNITDTSQMYKIVFVIRHHNAYHYKNIWVELNHSSAGEKAQTETFNLNLADDQKGWLGTGMDDIYDQRIPLYSKPVKLKYGTHTFTIKHTMREDPLQNILSTGIRIEKAAL
ncbi:MAG: gliding motility lipoprotein GldH [Bacteroidota bacterium]|jgi:gliding motility-associated lipoprotein GldH